MYGVYGIDPHLRDPCHHSVLRSGGGVMIMVMVMIVLLSNWVVTCQHR